MRSLLASALVLVLSACADRPERAAGTGALAPLSAGQDPVVLRFPGDGGVVTAVGYPGLDSVVWRSTMRVPPLARLLAHDPEDGYLVAVDSTGRSLRLDLRLGSVTRAGGADDAGHATSDGATLFARRADGTVARYTPAEQAWQLTRATPPALLLPLRDGSLVFTERRGATVRLLRVRPPDSLVVDSLVLDDGLPADATVLGTVVADRLFVAAGAQVHSVRSRDFVRDVQADVGENIEALATSPSGDRVFVLAGDRDAVRVIDRFSGDEVARVRLPAAGGTLRPDPLGRVLLVEGAGDIVWVVDVGTASLVGALRSRWRADLPAVLPDGAVALVQGDTITLASTLDLGVVRTLPGRASERWYAMRWNGFRPRARGLDEPVRFREGEDSARPAEGSIPDSATSVPGTPRPPVTDSARRVADSLPSRPGVLSPDGPDSAAAIGFTVQFAAVLSEAQAREALAALAGGGREPRIVAAERDGRTVYRVVMGPFATRGEAERVGRASGQSYWVFEGAP
jgi:cell division septation protein DedD